MHAQPARVLVAVHPTGVVQDRQSLARHAHRLLVPWLLHYRHRAPSDEQESDELSARNPFQMFVVPTGLGAAVVGMY